MKLPGLCRMAFQCQLFRIPPVGNQVLELREGR
jgi:hypothetical protein